MFPWSEKDNRPIDVLGLMSGTSLDAIDAVRVRFRWKGGRLADWELLDYRQASWPSSLRRRLERVVEGESLPASQWSDLHFRVAEVFAEFVLSEFGSGKIADLASFPGQTVHHQPEGESHGFQIGSPAVFAARTGIDTVGDFRSPDLAHGGSGAPLVPLAELLLHSDDEEARVLLNLGGIANLTLLPPRAASSMRAWDVGPANTLMDKACKLAAAGPFDRDGSLAARGRVHQDLLETWLSDPWFARQPPKSTGRDYFGGSFLGREQLLSLLERIGLEDLLATLVGLTVSSVASDLVRAVSTTDFRPDSLYVSGGGRQNHFLMKKLAEALDPLPVFGGEQLGFDPQAKEALDFALLGLLAARGGAVALPGVTGAQVSAPAGCLSPAQAHSCPTIEKEST